MIGRPWRRIGRVLTVAASRWLAPRTSLTAAALAFQALLALAPLLLLALPIAARALGGEAARRSLSEAAVRFAGPDADRIVAPVLDSVAASRWPALGTVLGIALLLYFASDFFTQLCAGLDAIWGVKRKGLRRAFVRRLASVGQTVVAVAAMLLILELGVLRSLLWPVLARTGAPPLVWAVWTRLGTFLLTAAILAAALRYLPDVRPRPRPAAVLAGSVTAALILNLGSEILGRIIARSALASLYGAAGSVIMLLLWIYYSVWIILFGAELCRAWDEAAPPGGVEPAVNRT